MFSPKKLWNYIFPRICFLCGMPSKRNIDLCADCENDLPKMAQQCLYCVQPLIAKQNICGRCVKCLPVCSCTIALYYYQKPIDFLISQLKFQRNLIAAKLLGQLLAQHLEKLYSAQKKPEIIIPIPLHKKRLRERGFNQALELAKPVARALKIPIDKYKCVRVKNTAAQTLITTDERVKNVRNAFMIQKVIHAKHVAVIDDVITTGSTIREFCGTLQKVGVTRIDVWCVARAGNDQT
jgi:ComF family protein